MKYLTNSGLSYFFNKIKAYIASQLNSKASAIHTHTYSEIVDLPNGIAVDSTLDGTSSNAIANSAVKNALDGKINKNDIYNLIYPVGSIYLSVNSVDPSTIFGGTWEQIKDTFLLSSGDTYSIGSTGGEATHTLTIDEMPSHNHSAISDSNGDHNHSLVSITGYDDHNFINGTGEFLIQNSDTTMGWPDAVATSLKYGSTGNAGSHSHSLTVNSTGGSQPHNNMPPYLTVNIWKRTA